MGEALPAWSRALFLALLTVVWVGDLLDVAGLFLLGGVDIP